MNCRHCATPLTNTLVDLGSAPPSNAYLTRETLNAPEKWFPLRVLVCHSCWLVQTEDFAQADELFDEDYAYFSSFSSSWLEHAKAYVDEMIERFKLDHASHVFEIAANDGYLLQYVKQAGIPCTGVEPTAATAAAARQKGISIVEDFFGVHLADGMVRDGLAADLIAANNVLAHVPDINDFVSGFTRLLKPNGVATFEFPHLLRLIEENQFDTIYHEHFSYLSLIAVKRIFASNGLAVFDVERLSTHGGSLRVYAQRTDTGQRCVTPAVHEVLQIEIDAGLQTIAYYTDFQEKAEIVKNQLMDFLLQAKSDDKTVAGYGAAAKGNTLLNYAGIRPDLIQFIVDRNPAKQEKYMPGSRIPIVTQDELYLSQPDYIIVFPWNLLFEISDQLQFVRKWGGKLVVGIPNIRII